MQKAEKSQTPRELSLEERIKRIIHSPVLELDGDAYLDNYELNSVKSIRDFILSKLRGKTKNIDTGIEITVSKPSAKKLAGRYKDGETYQKTIIHIPAIIKDMKFLEEMQPHKENANFGKYSYYITRVNIDGKSYTILSIIGREGNEIYYDQNVFEGTPLEVFTKTKYEANNPKYVRLNEILRNIKKDS